MVGAGTHPLHRTGGPEEGRDADDGGGPLALCPPYVPAEGGDAEGPQHHKNRVLCELDRHALHSKAYQERRPPQRPHRLPSHTHPHAHVQLAPSLSHTLIHTKPTTPATAGRRYSYSATAGAPAKNMAANAATTAKDWDRARHVKYFVRCLKGLSVHYTSGDATRCARPAPLRMPLAYALRACGRHNAPADKPVSLCVCACVCAGGGRVVLAFFAVSGLDLLGALGAIADRRRALCEWLYTLQVVVPGRPHADGFRGGAALGGGYDGGHLAATYSALAILVILGDDLARVDRTGIQHLLARLQQPSGAYDTPPTPPHTHTVRVSGACAVIVSLCVYST
jgi:hypothetical protein